MKSAEEQRALFEELLTPHLDALFRTAASMTHNEADAEDLVQESCVRAFRFFYQFEPGSNFRAWIFRILTNTHLNARRQKGRRLQTVSYDAEIAEDFSLYEHVREGPWSVEAENPAESVLRKLDEEQVRAAITSLPEEFRLAVTLVDMEQFTYPEAAEVLGCPVGTVRSRLHRGRRLLQAALWQYFEETERPAGKR